MILYRLVGPCAHLSGVLLRLRSEHFRGAWEWLRGAVRRLFLWPYLRSAYADEEIFLWSDTSGFVVIPSANLICQENLLTSQCRCL